MEGGMNNGIIKLGIIGTNFVSDWMCESVGMSDGIENYAVYSRTREKGEDFARAHGISHVYTVFEEFLSSGIDAVYIASPNALHYPQAMAAVSRGLHIMVEKPACLSEQEFRSLEAAARKRGVVLMEAMRPAHDPAIGIIRDAARSIGVIRRASLEFCQYSSRYDRFKSGIYTNTFDPRLGNAALMDIGVYPMHLAVLLFGAPQRLLASSTKLAGGMEGQGCVLMDYGTHHVDVIYSKITDSHNPSVILGEDGAVTIGKLSTLENVGLHMRGGVPEPLIENRTENNMIYEIAHFVSAVRGELDLSGYNKMTRITLGLMDEVRKQCGISFAGETNM